MKKFSLLDLIKPYFIGKTLKYLFSHKAVKQDYLIRKKKSNNVTDDQFNSENPKYSMWIKRSKHIGYHMIFEQSKIIKVEMIYSGDEFESWQMAELTLENDVKISVDLYTKIIEIDKNTIMFEY
jgi:hypothetical protein